MNEHSLGEGKVDHCEASVGCERWGQPTQKQVPVSSRTHESHINRACAHPCRTPRQVCHQSPLPPPSRTANVVRRSAFGWRLFINWEAQPCRSHQAKEQERFERMQEALSQNGSPRGGRAKWKLRQREPKRERVGPSLRKEDECLPSGKKPISSPGRRNRSKMKRNLSKNQCFNNPHSHF